METLQQNEDYDTGEKPEILEITPELEMAWYGLCVCIENRKMTRKEAEEMLEQFARESPNYAP